MSDKKSDIGLIGLAVMGQNLVLNMADHGYQVSVYNRTTAKTDAFIAENKEKEPSAERVLGFAELKDFVDSIASPRKIVLLVKSTAVLPDDRDAVDATIDGLKPLLDKGDIIIDGGNSNWNATIRREKALTAEGYEFIGTGVSGGELGARFGPSLMPGGSPKAWESLRPIWEAIAAKVDPKTGKPYEDYKKGVPITEGETCTTHIGADGAGHYVKMVHNGIEYIDMQLICEAYQVMKDLLGMQPDAMSKVFGEWNAGLLDSFLIEITTDILQQKDPVDPSRFFVDIVLDAAGQKGTGKWTSTSALDLGIPANAIAEAVFARCLSAIKEERVAASKVLQGPDAPALSEGKEELVAAIHDALYSSKICAYAQGFQLMTEAQNEYGWKLDFAEIAKIFRGGCIIRARFAEPHARPVLHRRAAPLPAKLAQGRQPGRAARRAHPRLQLGPGLLRRLPLGSGPGQPAAGPARLLRCSHLRAHRSAPRQEVPRGLARSRPAPDRRVSVPYITPFPAAPVFAGAVF